MSKRKEAEDSEGGGKRQKSLHESKSQFEEAVRKGDLEECKKIVNECEEDERESLMNVQFGDFQTFLHTAADKNHVSIINWLLSSEEGGGRSLGFKMVLARTKFGSTALHLASSRGHLDACKAIVNGCHVDNGERQEMLNAVDDSRTSVLHHAASSGHTAVVSWLMSSEEGGGRSLGFSNILARTKFGETALHLAAQMGSMETCKAVVNGCRVDNGERQEMLNAVCKHGMTVLHFASSKVASWLLSEEEGGGRSLGFTNVLARTKVGDTALHVARRLDDSKCFYAIVNGCRSDNGERQEMLNAVDNDGMTILHHAAEVGNASNIMDWILSQDGGRAAGFNLVTARATGKLYTALHIAVRQTNVGALQALLSDCTSEERRKLFLAVDTRGWTILHHAARKRSIKAIKELLSYSECAMVVNMKDNRGMTALHRAIIGGFDKESRDEWDPRGFRVDIGVIRALTGMNDNSSSSSSSSSTAKVTKAWIDPNIGLGL